MNSTPDAEETVEASPEVGPTTDVELLRHDYVQLCTGVKRAEGGVEIEVACRPSTFADMQSLYAATPNNRHPLFYRRTGATDDMVSYVIMVPKALLSEPLRFEARDGKGRIERTLIGGSKKMAMPPQWRFSRYDLALGFDPVKPEPAVDPGRIFLRSIDVHNSTVTFDLSFFTPNEAPQAGRLVFVRMQDNEVVHAMDLPLVPAKKAFRIPAALHRNHSKTTIFHAQATAQVRDIFDDLGVYEVRVELGGDTFIIAPYNRYYFDKPSTFVISDQHGSHVLKHFVDPISGALRLTYH